MDLNFNQIEVNLRNYYFILSSLVTVYYWVRIIFIPKFNLPKIGYWGIGLLNIILSIQLIGRWITSGHFPLSGLYESLLFLAWSVSFIYLFIERFIKNEFVGIIISPFLLCLFYTM